MNETVPFSVPAALLGQAVLFLLFILVVSVVLREAARVVIKVAVVVAIGVAIAVLAGWLDQSLVGEWLTVVGDWAILALREVVLWLTRAWEAVAGAAGGGGGGGAG